MMGKRIYVYSISRLHIPLEILIEIIKIIKDKPSGSTTAVKMPVFHSNAAN